MVPKKRGRKGASEINPQLTESFLQFAIFQVHEISYSKRDPKRPCYEPLPPKQNPGYAFGAKIIFLKFLRVV